MDLEILILRFYRKNVLEKSYIQSGIIGNIFKDAMAIGVMNIFLIQKMYVWF